MGSFEIYFQSQVLRHRPPHRRRRPDRQASVSGEAALSARQHPGSPLVIALLAIWCKVMDWVLWDYLMYEGSGHEQGHPGIIVGGTPN